MVSEYMHCLKQFVYSTKLIHKVHAAEHIPSNNIFIESDCLKQTYYSKANQIKNNTTNKQLVMDKSVKPQSK